MKQPIVVFGVGDFAQVAHSYFAADSSFEVAAFTADQGHIRETTFCGCPVVPFDSLAGTYSPSVYGMFVAIGYRRLNYLRAQTYERAKAKGYRLVSYVHSSVYRWTSVSIGDNCFIFEENVLQPFVTIGDDVILWSGNHIGHHSTIEDHCFVASHAVLSGNVTIGRHCFVGVNATISDGVAVAAENIVGAGVLLTHDTKVGEVFRAARTRPATVSSRKLWGV